MTEIGAVPDELLLLQSLLTYSIEGFLTSHDVGAIFGAIDEVLPAHLSLPLSERGSIHGITGLDIEGAVAIYEPNGRIELAPLPAAALEVLDTAVERRRADIGRCFPSLETIGPWFYAEYGPGQFVTPHVDRMRNKVAPDHPKLGGISVVLEPPQSGGAFFVETSGHPDLWRGEAGGWEQVKGLTARSQWFLDTPRTRWTSAPVAGSAVLYGSQLVHGTLPVEEGRVRKVISWLNA